MAEPINTNENHDLVALNKIDGKAVHDMSVDRLGTIINVFVDKRCCQGGFDVLQFGGFLGNGADHYPIP